MAPIEGYWGKSTSTIDWCEENYVVNFFMAEFWNTITSGMLVVAPLVTTYYAIKEKHEQRNIYCFLASMVVGIGSWLFHMTLWYSMQLMDEVPMIWGSLFLIYAMCMVDSKPGEERWPLLIMLTIYCAIVTLVYIIINNPVFHEAAYGLMVFAIVGLGTRNALKFECSKVLYVCAVITYGMGFFLWNVDNIYCHHLKALRTSHIGKFSGMLFQFHAWWHVFAGLGTYLCLVFNVHTRYLYLKKNPQIKFLLGCWPYVSIAQTGGKGD